MTVNSWLPRLLLFGALAFTLSACGPAEASEEDRLTTFGKSFFTEWGQAIPAPSGSLKIKFSPRDGWDYAFKPQSATVNAKNLLGLSKEFFKPGKQPTASNPDSFKVVNMYDNRSLDVKQPNRLEDFLNGKTNYYFGCDIF